MLQRPTPGQTYRATREVTSLVSHASCPECGYFQESAPRCCECAAPLVPLALLEPVESDADLLAALYVALEDDESEFYVWTPGTPLDLPDRPRLTSSERAARIAARPV